MSKVVSHGNLVQNPETFEELVLSPTQSVRCDNEGNFYVENRLIAIIREIVRIIFGDFFGWEARKHEGWAKGLVHVLDQFEQKRFEVNELKYGSYLKTAKTVEGILEESKSPKVKDALLELKIRTSALEYRLDECSDDISLQRTKEQLYEELKPLAEVWKKTQIVFKSSILSEKENDQLKILAQYPKVATFVRDNKTLRKQFFRWALLAQNNVHAIVQFPKTTRKLIEVGLSERIGRYGGSDLKIVKIDDAGKCYKDLTLPFEGTARGILDETNEVILSHGYKLSIEQIFKIFKKRTAQIDNLEYFGSGQGITNWNSHEWGPFVPANNACKRIDVTKSDWIKEVKFSEIISEAEALERFEDKDCNKLKFNADDWVFSVVAKNQYRHANLRGSHALLRIAVPFGDGRRGLCYLSKFPEYFPDPEKETKRFLRMGIDVVPGALQMPDENFYKIDRVEEEVSRVVCKEQAQIVLKRISKDKLLVENGAFYFQFLIYNCTDWVFKKLRRKEESETDLITGKERDEIALMSLSEAQPEGLAGLLMSFPKKVRDQILKVFNGLLFFKPKGQLKMRFDNSGREIRLISSGREIRVTSDNVPWKQGVYRPHPAKIILGKCEKRTRVLAPPNAGVVEII